VHALEAALAQAEAAINLADPVSGLTPSTLAVKNDHADTVAFLLEAGADPAQLSPRGIPVLVDAASSNDCAIVRLLDKGAHIEQASKNGWTPLCLAAANRHYAMVEILLNKGANIEHADENGWTPLCWAAANGHLAVVELLLNKNANIEQTNKDGQTPLYLAAANGHPTAVNLLLNQYDHTAQATKCQALMVAIDAMHPAVVELLLRRGVAAGEGLLAASRDPVTWGLLKLRALLDQTCMQAVSGKHFDQFDL